MCCCWWFFQCNHTRDAKMFSLEQNEWRMLCAQCNEQIRVFAGNKWLKQQRQQWQCTTHTKKKNKWNCMSRNGKANKKNQHLMIAHRKKTLQSFKFIAFYWSQKLSFQCLVILTANTMPIYGTIWTHSIKIIS